MKGYIKKNYIYNNKLYNEIINVDNIDYDFGFESL